MISRDKVLLLDVGNTHVKAALANNGVLSEIQRFPLEDQYIDELMSSFGYLQKLMSSVINESQTKLLANKIAPCEIVTSETPLPIEIDYLTPRTLGLDRICNACAMLRIKRTKVAVAIDIGTCIKFDLLKENCYLGGSISPGIDLRYQSLHDFTGRLPLINLRSKIDLTGNTSEKSMHSGVINGIQKEIEGFMEEYRRKYTELSFFITGGDASYFDFGGKNDIFAVENLTLEGLYSIFTFNAR